MLRSALRWLRTSFDLHRPHVERVRRERLACALVIRGIGRMSVIRGIGRMSLAEMRERVAMARLLEAHALELRK